MSDDITIVHIVLSFFAFLVKMFSIYLCQFDEYYVF